MCVDVCVKESWIQIHTHTQLTWIIRLLIDVFHHCVWLKVVLFCIVFAESLSPFLSLRGSNTFFMDDLGLTFGPELFEGGGSDPPEAIACVLGEWSEFGECSEPCGGGEKVRLNHG